MDGNNQNFISHRKSFIINPENENIGLQKLSNPTDSEPTSIGWTQYLSHRFLQTNITNDILGESDP